jgi:hypothetical protein
LPNVVQTRQPNKVGEIVRPTKPAANIAFKVGQTIFYDRKSLKNQ